MMGWIMLFITTAVLVLGAYAVIRLLVTLHRDEFTDPEV
jgi:hypothetical protein